MSGSARDQRSAAARPGRPAALLLHGQPGWGELWERVRERLAPDLLVLAPDRPGWGESPHPAGDLDRNVDAAREALDEAGVSRAVVAAHSWAAAVALRLADRHPGRVAGLVLVAPAATSSAYGPVDRVLGTVAGGPLVRAGFALAAHTLGSRPFGWVVQRAGAGGIDSPTVARRLGDPRAWRSFLVEERAALSQVGEIERRLDAIEHRVLVLEAEHDRVVPARAVRDVADRLRRAERIVVPAGGHMLPLQRPGRVAAAIRRVADETG